MAEFWALVSNENLKIRRRKFIWIALAVVLVISFGFSALIGILTRESDDWDYEYSTTLAESLQTEIEYTREVLKTETDERIKEEFQKEIYSCQILLDAGVTSRQDWRCTTDIATRYAIAVLDDDAVFAERLKGLICGNDYLGYYRYLMEENQAQYAGNPAFIEAANAGYQFCLENQIAMLLLSSCTANALETAKNSYVLLEYRLKNNIRINPGDSFQLIGTLTNLGGGSGETSRLWDTLNTTLSLTSIVQILSIILAAGMVASEFGKGTIKFLLIAPATRWRILLSKYCSLLINMALLFFALLLGNVLFGILFCGGSDFFLPILTATGGAIKRSSPILLLIGNYLLELVGMLVMVTLAFMISSLFRNSGAAVGISLLIYYGGSTVNSILAFLGADWGRYLIFANINLSNILRGASVFPHQSIWVAIVVLALHMAVFLWTAFDAFDRKEI